MADREYTLTEADDFGRRAQKQRTKLENPFPWILRIRQRFVDAGGSPRAFDHCVESYAATAVERALRDERAKRPDREQFHDEAWEWSSERLHPSPAIYKAYMAGVDAVLSSLALEPGGRA